MQLVAAADVNKDGVIEYKEFVPLALELMKAAAAAAAPAAAEDDEALGSASDYSQAELEDYIARLFAIGDVNGDGVLDPAELDK